MAGKFDRERLYPVIDRDNTQVLDFVLFDFRYINQFLSTKSFRQHQVTSIEEGRLDLISYNEYGTVELWWLIGMINGIVDPFVDVTVGLLLNIPAITDIESYLQVIRTIKRGQNSVIRS